MRSLDIYFKNDKMNDIFNHYNCDLKDREVLQKILELEWEFFDKVNGLNGRAVCQDDSYMFIVMRLAQHLLFSKETRLSILNDYEAMKIEGVNPIEGKYARMMKYTDEKMYEKNLSMLPNVSPIKRQKIMDLIKLFEKSLVEIKSELPNTIKNTRPFENTGKSISSLSYFYAELTFFSYRTLRLMKKDVIAMNNPTCVERIFQNTVILNKYLT